ncbi:MAG TPA: hypothetical protein VGM98_04345 [Schlesneria sp.]
MADSPKNEPASDEPKRFCGKSRRSGPPKGNVNNMRHGLKAGKLPPGCQYIEVRMNLFRRELESAVIAVKGEINLIDAANIQTAMKWERHGALAQRWLTKEADTLKPVERLTFSREIARASTERDRALTALGLDRNQVRDQWAALDAIPIKEADNGD